MQKWKCNKCGFVYVGNTPPPQCIKCSTDKSYAKHEPEQTGTPIQWKCRRCGYSYLSDLMMELCPFCRAECPFVDDSNYLPPEDHPQKPFTDKEL